jgi:UDPglucose--hexose-1-phosphate uridylyltransferase
MYEGKWEKRWHPLRGEWVVYAAHRNRRPWTTGTQAPASAPVPMYDPTCYLCPGNARVHGAVNPPYTGVYVFDNDHPVVGPHAPAVAEAPGLYRRASAQGVARVLCYDPRHDTTLAELPVAHIAEVFRAFRAQVQDLAGRPTVESVLIFENKGELCGVSNPHPHCQLYAVDFGFALIGRQMELAQAHRQATGRNLFADILAAEQADGRRIVAQNAGAVAFIPFFARYAYEVMIFPRQRHATLLTLTDGELGQLAAVYREVTARYDGLFGLKFPYVMTVQQAPVKGSPGEFHLYFHFQPPLRQPGLVKFLAGPEIGAGNFMADTMPEDTAAELRQVPLGP